MTIRYLEVKASSMNTGALSLIKSIEAQGIKKGQLLWIDAHSYGKQEFFLAAYWNDRLNCSEPPAKITYKGFEVTYDKCTDSYGEVSKTVSKIAPENLISITSTECWLADRSRSFLLLHLTQVSISLFLYLNCLNDDNEYSS